MRERRSVRTSMGLSTLDGLVMGTRPGAVDIGVALFAQQQLGLDLETLSRGLYHKSGLLGLSGISADMRVLAASDDPFIHQFLARQPSRESRILGGSWSAMVESRRESASGRA